MSTMTKRPQVWLAAGAAVLALTVAACGGDDDSTADAATTESTTDDVAALQEIAAQTPRQRPVQWVGTLDDDENAYVAVHKIGDRVDVYLCDGDERVGWIDAALDDDGAFSGENDAGLAVTGTVDDESAAGAITLTDGSRHAFTLQRAELPAGLYEIAGVDDGKPFRSGTIVLPDGTSRGQVRQPPARDTQVCLQLKQNYRTWIQVAAAAESGSDERAEALDAANVNDQRYKDFFCGLRHGAITE
jgi:hypothetical protein